MKNLSDMLCSTLLLFCFLSSSKVDAWGGLFNRFNPSMLSDLGYGGGSYGKELYSAAHSGVRILIGLSIYLSKRYISDTKVSLSSHMFYLLQAASNTVDNSLDEESEAGGNGCAGKMCTANEHCCDKHVCVDADESKYI